MTGNQVEARATDGAMTGLVLEVRCPVAGLAPGRDRAPGDTGQPKLRANEVIHSGPHAVATGILRREPGSIVMARVQDVADYILRKEGGMTAMKLQKLCYYAYGFHLAWEGRRLFPESFQAWANGPVSPALYRDHRGQFTLVPGDIPGDLRALDDGERESVDLVLEAYGLYTAHQLSVMTHGETPWVRARRRSKAGPLERSTARLRDEEIAEYFDTLATDSANAAEG